MPNPNSQDLAGITVVVTRPAHQAQSLIEKIEQRGGKVIRYPVLTIEAPTDLVSVVKLINRLNEFHIAIFISANAVDQAMNFIEDGHLPEHIKVAAVGKATAKALKKQGQTVHIVPQDEFSSEALLSHPALGAVAGKKVVIFRGEGGRELLADTLTARGAKVEYAQCYRRGKPTNPNNTELLRHWANNDIDVVTVMSNEALQNLYDMVGEVGRHWLQSTPIIGVSDRVVELAKQLGIQQPPIVTNAVSDDAIVETILESIVAA